MGDPRKIDLGSKTYETPRTIERFELGLDAGIGRTWRDKGMDYGASLQPSYRWNDFVRSPLIFGAFGDFGSDHRRWLFGGVGVGVDVPIRNGVKFKFDLLSGPVSTAAGNAVQGHVTPQARVQFFDFLSVGASTVFTPNDSLFTFTVGIDPFGRTREKVRQERLDNLTRTRGLEREYESQMSATSLAWTDAEKRAIQEMSLAFKKRQPDFLKYVRQFHARDLVIEQTPEIVLKDKDISHTSYFFLKTELKKAGMDLVGSNQAAILQMWNGDASPDVVIRNLGQEYLEKDSRFLSSNLSIPVPMISLFVRKINGVSIMMIQNWFQETPFFLKKYPATLSSDFWTAVAYELTSAIKAHRDGFNLEQAVKALPQLSATELSELEGIVVYKLVDPQGWSAAERQQNKASLTQLLALFEIGFDALPFCADIDRKESKGISYEDSTKLSLTSSMSGAMDNKVLQVRGFLDAIDLKVNDKAQKIALARDPRLRDPHNAWFQDKYGNLISPQYAVDPLSHTPMILGIDIQPPYDFVDGPTADAQPRKHGVDLSRLGLGDHPNLFLASPLAPYLPKGDGRVYSLYSTLPRSDLNKNEKAIERVIASAKDGEAYWGFTPGQAVKQIVTVPSAKENASIRLANPHAFFVWDEILAKIAGGGSDFVVPHEICHNLDAQFHFSEYPAFDELYFKLRRSSDNVFFSSINETYFYARDRGGHARDNPREFFASIVNSIRASDWEQKVRQMPARIRSLYFHGLTIAEQALVSKYGAIKTSPLYKQLTERIAALKLMRTEIDKTNSPYDPVDSLVQPTTSDLLKKGPNPIRVIGLYEFSREVLKASGPVVVYVFLDEPNSAAARDKRIRQLATQVGRKAKFVAIPFHEAGPLFLSVFHGSLESLPYVFEDGKIIFEKEISPRPEELTPEILRILSLPKQDRVRLAPSVTSGTPPPSPIHR